MNVKIATGNGWSLVLGDWRDHIECADHVDTLITDPPYSPMLHSKHRSDAPERPSKPLSYGPWDSVESDVPRLLDLTRGWSVIATDHRLWHTIDRMAEAAGRYTFQPVPIVTLGGRVRMTGDGPSSWCVYLHVSRPREDAYRKWRTLPGAYVERGSVKGAPIIGAKKVETMRAIVRDYSRPGDVVYDPYAGTGTTLLAAIIEGRHAIGCEINEEVWEFAVKRLRAHDAQPYLPGLGLGPNS